MNIAEYREKLGEYSKQIENFNKVIAQAEKDKIIAKTKLDSCTEEIRALEAKAQSEFGVPVSELPSLMENKMQELEKVIAQINEMQKDFSTQVQEGEVPC